MEIVRIFSIDIKCCIFFISAFFVLSSHCSKQYRTDYVYNSVTDAFYKFHMEEVLNTHAQALCAAEGASLMVPRSAEDLAQALKLYEQYPNVRSIAWIGKEEPIKHESDEEMPHFKFAKDIKWAWEPRIYCAILDRTGKTQTFGCFHNMPFVCKVDAKDVIYDKQCKVFGKATKKGTLQVTSDKGIQGVLEEVLFCPEVPYNLLSVSRMQRAGLTVIFDEKGADIRKGNTTIMQGQQLADALTKPLPVITFQEMRSKMGLE